MASRQSPPEDAHERRMHFPFLLPIFLTTLLASRAAKSQAMESAGMYTV